MKKNKIIHAAVIATFVSLYLLVSVISAIHVVDFFRLSNGRGMAITLAVAFELGAAASLCSLVILDKVKRGLVWTLFVALTLFQMMGNTYFAYANLGDYSKWSALFGLAGEDPILQMRILAILSGAILPLVALGFIKALVDYLKPEAEAPVAGE